MIDSCSIYDLLHELMTLDFKIWSQDILNIEQILFFLITIEIIRLIDWLVFNVTRAICKVLRHQIGNQKP